jgi:hypothetical protein
MAVFSMAAASMTGCAVNGVNDAYNGAMSFASEKADAYRVACDTVREQLDAPSKAVFPTYSSSYVKQKSSDNASYDEMYVVEAYVEAENMFGGTVKVNWGARVYPTKDDQFYIVLDYLE